MTNDEGAHRALHSSFVIRHSSFFCALRAKTRDRFSATRLAMFWFALLTNPPGFGGGSAIVLSDRGKAFAPVRRPGRIWELVWSLLAQTQLIERRLVSRRRGALEVIKKPAAACDHLEQAAARGMILRVGLEMLGEVIDARSQDGDLHIRAAGVFLVQAEG